MSLPENSRGSVSTRTPILERTYRWLYEVEHVGFKYHGNSIMAAIALVQLKYLDQDNVYRRQLCDWYIRNLEGNKDIKIVPVTPGCEPSRHLFQVLVDNRDELILALNEKGVAPGVHYRDNTEYSMYRYAKGTCPRAHEVSSHILSLPLHLRMTKDDVNRVSELLIEYTRKLRRKTLK
jgi:dTDP-4-amino-4,6-dideoxygalactose transaminase